MSSPVDDCIAWSVLSYWQEKTNTIPRSDKVRKAYLARIRKRLDDGFSAAELCRCVDVARWDEFYVKQGYYKHPEIIWRNAERVSSLLARAAHAAARPIPL